MCTRVDGSEQPISEENEEEKNDHHDNNLGHERGSEVQITGLFPVPLRTDGELLSFVT